MQSRYQCGTIQTGCVDIRIEGGGCSGRLECQLEDKTWSTVCENGLGTNAAFVACRQLGYTGHTLFTAKA